MPKSRGGNRVECAPAPLRYPLQSGTQSPAWYSTRAPGRNRRIPRRRLCIRRARQAETVRIFSAQTIDHKDILRALKMPLLLQTLDDGKVFSLAELPVQ